MCYPPWALPKGGAAEYAGWGVSPVELGGMVGGVIGVGGG